uniref:HPr family phosphocarrier protein n=1 Tax=Roseburia inulinivorans TaxID=360807 RepID=UPI0040387DEA
MKEFKYVIKDEQGIHARPAGVFVMVAAALPCHGILENDGNDADANRRVAGMGLAVKCGQEITLKTDGENEEEAMNKLSAFLEENL